MGQLRDKVLHHVGCETLLNEKRDSKTGPKSLRHYIQQSSIVGHMAERGFLQPSHVFMEFGAGKGMLSSALSQVLPTSRMILIDRSRGGRFKVIYSVQNLVVHTPL